MEIDELREILNEEFDRVVREIEYYEREHSEFIDRFNEYSSNLSEWIYSGYLNGEFKGSTKLSFEETFEKYFKEIFYEIFDDLFHVEFEGIFKGVFVIFIESKIEKLSTDRKGKYSRGRFQKLFEKRYKINLRDIRKEILEIKEIIERDRIKMIDEILEVKKLEKFDKNIPEDVTYIYDIPSIDKDEKIRHQLRFSIMALFRGSKRQKSVYKCELPYTKRRVLEQILRYIILNNKIIAKEITDKNTVATNYGVTALFTKKVKHVFK